MSTDRPAVLVVHGALGSAEQMQSIVDALVASERFGDRVVVIAHVVYQLTSSTTEG